MRAGVAIITGRAVSLGSGIALGPLIVGCAYLCPGALTVSCPCGAGSAQVKLFVHRCVAVIIYPVADLSRSWMDSGGTIITVDVIVNIPFGRSTRLRGGCRVPVPIAISITVEGGWYDLHDYSIRRCRTVPILDGEPNIVYSHRQANSHSRTAGPEECAGPSVCESVASHGIWVA